MKNDRIVTINGHRYDSVTGKPMAFKQPTNAKQVHSATQKSQTLYRRAVKKPTNPSGPQMPHKKGRNMDIARSRAISHFAPHQINKTITKPPTTTKPLSAPLAHPIVSKAIKKRQPANHHIKKTNPPVPNKPAKVIKEEAIAAALSKPTVKPQKVGFIKKHLKFINIFSISIIILAITGYLVYTNIPGISVRVASAMAGINATYPDYHPDGYKISGPVTYTDNEVLINFQSNTNDTKFTIKQTKSSWDSSAVKNMVIENSNGKFITTTERGLTIFTYNGNAAWVNGGILYTVTGDAPLSSSQIGRIAMSF